MLIAVLSFASTDGSSLLSILNERVCISSVDTGCFCRLSTINGRLLPAVAKIKLGFLVNVVHF